MRLPKPAWEARGSGLPWEQSLYFGSYRSAADASGDYILLDGFDLGVGILFPFAPSDQCRDRMMNSIAPFWDGNETWLVLGGGGYNLDNIAKTWTAVVSAMADGS